MKEDDIDTKKIQTPSERDETQRTIASHTQKLAPPINWGDLGQVEHIVQFYETDSFLLDSVSDFVGAGLGSGAACIVLATLDHRQGLSQRLQANGLDMASLRARGKYFPLDAAQILAQILREGSPDPQQFMRESLVASSNAPSQERNPSASLGSWSLCSGNRAITQLHCI